MKKRNLVLLLVVAVSLGAIVACDSASKAAEPVAIGDPQTFTPEQIKHGSYLVTAIGCDDCHSPKTFGPNGPEVDTLRRLSGRPSNLATPSVDTASLKSWMLFAHDLTAAVGPWGVSFSANLTSDETGIGNWSFSQFKKAIREGKYKGQDNSRPLLPPMPWQQYRNLSDEDLRDIFAFLKSTRPVRNVVPAPVPLSKL
jgi:cytochrome c553